MRILHLVSYSLFSGPLPGTLGLALAQRKLGHEVFLAYDRKRGAFNSYEEAAAPRVESYALNPSVPLVMSAKSTPYELIFDAVNLREFVKDGQINIVHVHLSHDHLLARLALNKAVPIVRTLHANRSLERRLGQRWLFKNTQRFIVRSAAHNDRLCFEFSVPRAHVAVIPSGIDADCFKPASQEMKNAARARFALPHGKLILGHVALMANRGQIELLQAIASLGEAAPHVLMVGRGECEESVFACVKELKLQKKITFTGYLQGEDLLQAYAAMDAAFVMQPGNDASARAALEAMACALPVVARQIDALAETVTLDNGYPFNERSAAAVAQALGQLVADEQRQSKGQKGRSWIERERSFLHEARATDVIYGL